MAADDQTRPAVSRHESLTALVVTATWVCSFLGTVWILYGMRHNNALTNYEAVGCAMLSDWPRRVNSRMNQRRLIAGAAIRELREVRNAS